MQPRIETLIQDIQQVFIDGKELTDEEAAEFGSAMAKMIQRRLQQRPSVTRGSLRMSNIGKPDRQLWYQVNMPEKAEKMHPNAYMKFLIGDVIEEVLLFMAKHAGHDVQGEQDTMKLNGIIGHRDAVIDGVTVDAKSASPYSFQKFKDGLKADQDPFGYDMQLQSYIKAAEDDDKVTDKERGAFLVVQKVTGDMTLDIHPKTNIPISQIIEHKKAVVSQPDPPERCFEPEPMGKSGNMKLGLNCSYCEFKKICWPELRTFLYSSGPVYLTETVKVPDVYEVLE
jgi:hypothetical protein